jgi:hypothetical protein
MRIITTSDGTYHRIPSLQRTLIVGRIQSWILQESESGAHTTDLVLPLAKSKTKPQLRPGQSKPKPKPQHKPKPKATAKPKPTIKQKAALNKKPTRSRNHTPSSSEGNTYHSNATFQHTHTAASSDDSDSVPLGNLKKNQVKTKPMKKKHRKKSTSSEGNSYSTLLILHLPF